MSCKLSIQLILFLVLHLYSDDVHGAAPTFDFPPSGGATETVAENVATGTSVYTLIITDADGDVPTFSIASQVPATPEFTLSSNSIVQTPNVALDAETSTSFAITFDVTDGVNVVTSSVLTVDVTDVNEFSPVFTAASYTGSVIEGAPDGTSVTTVTATDADVTGTVAYTIQGAQTTFNISDSGEITVATSGDLVFATTPSYSLTVRASDGTNSNDVTVTISVTDSPCLPNPCANSGSCTTSGSSFTCTCTSGWTGSTCSSIDYCVTNYCQNGAACSSIGSTYSCACASGYTGRNCTEAVESSSDTAWVIPVAVVLSVGLIAATVAVVVYILYKQKGKHSQITPNSSKTAMKPQKENSFTILREKTMSGVPPQHKTLS